jgi:hypothetical protein
MRVENGGGEVFVRQSNATFPPQISERLCERRSYALQHSLSPKGSSRPF